MLGHRRRHTYVGVTAVDLCPSLVTVRHRGAVGKKLSAIARGDAKRASNKGVASTFVVGTVIACAGVAYAVYALFSSIL